MDERARIARCIMETVEARGQGRTICPSEVARRLAADWRPMMPLVRSVAADLLRQGRLRVTRRGRPVDPLAARGPIRLGRPDA
jgi:hypothetical protein